MANEKRLIYADDLIKIMRAEDIRYPDVPWSTTAVAKLCEPMTVDAVVVVRCKDCKHYNVYRLECHNGHMNGYIGIDGFCSYGERKGT